MVRPAIEVKNLSKRYRLGEINARSLREAVERLLSRRRGEPRAPDAADFWALKDVSFEVQPGEVLGIIGRNGAGKSTLLKILSRVTEPTEGEIRLRGRVASLLEVGTGFHPELSGRENIFLNGAVLGMTRAEIARKFDEIVDFSGVEKFLDTPVKRYSSGMYVRLAFAVAAHLEPEILIVDEVLAVGDAEFQRKCLGKMKSVSEGEGRTILFVSHNMPAIENLCDRCLYVRNGIIQYDGKASSAISMYLSQDTQLASGRDVRLLPRPQEALRPGTICEVWIEGENREETSNIHMGQKIRFVFRFVDESMTRSPGFGFGIDDAYGRRIASFNNYFAGKIYDPLGHGMAIWNVFDFPLLPGKYSLSVSLYDSNRTCIDWITAAQDFVVVGSDFFGSGRIPDEKQGIVALRGEFVLED